MNIFNQFTLAVVLITTINRLLGNRIDRTLVEENFFAPAFITITDNCPIRTVGTNVIIDKFDDFNPFRNHLKFSVSQITNPVHFSVTTKHTAISFNTKSVDAILTFFLQIFIKNLIFDQCDQLLIKLTQINGSTLNLQNFNLIFFEKLIDIPLQKASIDWAIQSG